MGRNERHDADYFPFYVKEGKTLFILESKYSLEGIGFFTNLMRFLTRQPDHHICIEDEANRLYFFAQIHCPQEKGMEMIDTMTKTGKLDKKLWDEHRVIASNDLLESLTRAYQNRKNPIITLEEIRISYKGNKITSTDNPQTKLKETKLKNIYALEFENFIKAYPKRVGKKPAYQQWEKAKEQGKLPAIDALLSALEKQKRAKQALIDAGQFASEWPDPERWIKNERWNDEIEKPKPGGTNVNRPSGRMGGDRLQQGIIPPEYRGDGPRPDVSPETVRANLQRIARITGGIGKGGIDLSNHAGDEWQDSQNPKGHSGGSH